MGARSIDEFGEDCPGSSHGATRPVTVQEVLDGPWTVSKLKAFWRQRRAVLSGKKPELLQAVGEDFDI